MNEQQRKNQNTQEMLDLLRQQNQFLKGIHWYCGFFFFAIIMRFIWALIQGLDYISQ